MDRDDAWPTGSSELLALAKELNDRVTALRERLRVAELENEKFQQIIARLKRMQFGRSSERHAGQFVLDLVADAGTEESKVPMPRPAANDDGAKAHPVRRPLPAHLPREIVRQDRKSTRLNSSHGYISYA